MIIFWIFTLFVGASTFAFTDIFLQLGLAWSIADAFVAMLLCRGIFSMREPTAADPYPPDLPMVPDQRAPIAAVSESA